MTTRRGFLLGTGAALAMPSLARAAEAAPPSGAQGWMLMDGDGRVVDAQNADRLFIPASVTKSVTAFAALSLLRPDSRFATSLLADGAIEGSTLRGDLHLVGGGDPSLDTADLAGLAKRLRAKGIRQVTGNFLYHDTALPRVPMLNGVQPWQAGYNPALSGLNLNFNRALMKWSGKGKGLRVEGLAHADARTVAAGNVRFVPSETATSFGHRLEAGGEIWTVPRDMLGRAGQRWMPVRDPGGYAAATFRALAQEAGVRLPPALPATLPPPALAPLAVHRSDVLYALLTRMMKYSTNLTAEVVGTTAALQVGGAPANIADGAHALADWMRGAGQVFAPGADAGLRLVNHSGLSSESRATPRQIATILDRGVARLGGAFDSLHVSGEVTRDGRKMSRAHALRSKTGTMHFVRCLAGTLEVAGRPHVFAIMSCDEARRAETDAAFSPYDETRPRGARSWLRAALAFESATLARWVEEA